MAFNVTLRLFSLGVSPGDLRKPPCAAPESERRPRNVASPGGGRYNDRRRLTNAQKDFLVVLARITVRGIVREIEERLEG